MLNNALSKLSSLRTKMLLVLALGMLLLFGLVFLIARAYLLNAYENLEKEQTKLQVKSAISLLNDQVMHLSSAVKDNAHWDDIYQYMVEQNPKFVESTFSSNTLTDLEVNAIFIIDNNGKALLARSLDYKTGKPWHIPDDLTQAISPGGTLIDPSISSQSGLYASPEGVFIVSAFDILNTKRTEPRRGTLIMLRSLEESTISHIENIVGSKISLDRMRDDELATLSPKFNKKTILVLPTSGSKVNGYALVNTINKGTNLVMTMHSDRKIFRQGQFSLKLLYLGSLVAALLLGAFSWLFNKLVLKKLAHLNTSVKQIGQSGNSSNRVTETAGNDELSSLAHGINGMLDQLEVAKQELLYEKERAQVTLASIAEAVITSDTAGNIRFANTAAEKLTGFKAKDIIGKPLEAIFNLTTVDKTSSVESSWLTNSQSAIDEVMLIDINGLEFILRKSASALHDAEGGVFGTVTVLHDVTALRMMSNKLSMQARFDALTGLPNRYEFDRKAQLAIEDAHNCAHTHCLAFIDLDKFKLVNDTCGHLAGDMFLQQLSQQMQQNLRASDTLARLGGDEFALLLMGCNLSKAHDILHDLLKSIESFRFNYDEKVFKVSASIGLTEISPKQKLSLNALLTIADSACYSAKSKGGNCVYEHNADDSSMQEQSNLLNWVSRINLGIENNQFVLFSQTLQSNKPDAEAHCELLIRMKADDGKLFLPSTFLPAAERYRLMPQLDRWVVNEALSIIARKGKKFNTLCAINLSGQSLSQEGFLAYVEEKIALHQVNPKRICFEITETAVISNLEKAQHFMRSLRAIGCRFSLDDFGSGLSSFAYLKNLEVDFLKIDGMFIKNIVDNKIDRAMVESINNVGHVMGLHTIGEFAENQAIIDILEEIGVDYAQGYGVSTPVLFE